MTCFEKSCFVETQIAKREARRCSLGLGPSLQTQIRHGGGILPLASGYMYIAIIYIYAYINVYYPHCMTPLDPSKPLFESKLGPFGHGKTSGDMVGGCMPNSGPGGCPGT